MTLFAEIDGAALAELDVPPERAIAVAATSEGIKTARAAGVHLAIAVARGSATPEQLRRAGADAVIAELNELL